MPRPHRDPHSLRIDPRGARAQYRAVGASISRNPNDWIYMMAQSYETAAPETSCASSIAPRSSAGRSPSTSSSFGGLFDLWDGFQCMFQEVAGAWPGYAPRSCASCRRPTSSATGTASCARHADTRRGPQAPALAGGAEDAALRRSPAPEARRRPRRRPLACLLARSSAAPSTRRTAPEPVGFCDDTPPLAFLALLEQKAQFRAWTRKLKPGWRWALIAGALARLRARGCSIYAMAHTQKACLVEVEVTGDMSAPPGPKRAITEAAG